MLKFYLNVKTILYAFSTFTLVDLYISLFFLFQVKMSHPWATDDVEGRYISLQAWLYIFLKNLLLFD